MNKCNKTPAMVWNFKVHQAFNLWLLCEKQTLESQTFYAAVINMLHVLCSYMYSCTFTFVYKKQWWNTEA